MEQLKRYQRTLNIKELLETSALANVMKKGLQINEINHHIQRIFPNQFNGLYQLANFDECSLTIHVANASVRQGFLFRQSELLHQIQRDYPNITTLHFKITPMLGR